MTQIDTLNEQFGRGEELRFVTGPAGLPHVLVRTGQASAEIALQGAQVLQYGHAGQPPVLFVSAKAIYAPGKSVRGGIPVIWPWFGPRPNEVQHGFARSSLWAVEASGGDAKRIWIRMGLSESGETLARWPHPFRLTLTVTVGPELDVALTTTNTGTTAFSYTEALHSYFAVADSALSEVIGLDGTRYIDKVREGTFTQQGPIGFADENLLDRVYIGTTATCRLRGEQMPFTIVIAKEGSRSTVVWNPGQEASRSFADLDEDDYASFVCVETANADPDAIVLEPGEQHTLRATISLEQRIENE